MGTSTKTRKTRLSIVKRFLPKFSKKTRTYGDFDENFQKFAGRLRVKEFLNNSKSMIHSRKNTAVKTY